MLVRFSKNFNNESALIHKSMRDLKGSLVFVCYVSKQRHALGRNWCFNHVLSPRWRTKISEREGIWDCFLPARGRATRVRPGQRISGCRAPPNAPKLERLELRISSCRSSRGRGILPDEPRNGKMAATRGQCEWSLATLVRDASSFGAAQ